MDVKFLQLLKLFKHNFISISLDLGWQVVDVKAVLWIAYNNQNLLKQIKD